MSRVSSLVSFLLPLLLLCAAHSSNEGAVQATHDLVEDAPDVCDASDKDLVIERLRTQLKETRALLRSTQIKMYTFVKNESNFQVFALIVGN